MDANIFTTVAQATEITRQWIEDYNNPQKEINPYGSIDSLIEIGTPPYNPFIVINQVRGVEVHLPDNAPTDKADQSLFGTADDNSNASAGRYYKTSNNLPWAINTGAQFAYPSEKSEITQAYLKFAGWAESSGSLYPDWFSNTGSGYRNNALIYSH